MVGASPDSASSSPARFASATPCSERRTSTHPVKRFFWFQSELPWRSRMSVEVTRKAYRGGDSVGAMVKAGRPEGRITRGTTGVNRLRRVDRWIAALPALRQAVDPLVVDLGYGASATTSNELHERLAAVRADVEVVGIEIDPERVRVASLAARPGVSFRLGGFEVPTDGGRRPAIIRAFNVLRQYGESEVADAWGRMTARLAPGGQLVEGTCDELGRISSWVTLDASGPHTFSVSLRL